MRKPGWNQGSVRYWEAKQDVRVRKESRRNCLIKGERKLAQVWLLFIAIVLASAWEWVLRVAGAFAHSLQFLYWKKKKKTKATYSKQFFCSYNSRGRHTHDGWEARPSWLGGVAAGNWALKLLHESSVKRREQAGLGEGFPLQFPPAATFLLQQG